MTRVLSGGSHWKKLTAVITGAIMGVSASFLAMIPAGHRTEAAIAVWDEKNIQQAIEMVKKSAEIKASADAQLAIQILQNKKLDLKYLQTWMKQTEKESKVLGGCFGTGKIEDPALKEILEKKGVFDPKTTIATAWSERLGDLNRLMKGDATEADVYFDEKKREEALAQTFLDAAKQAQAAGITGDQLVKDVQGLEEQSATAEGTLQAAQIGNSMQARGVMAIANQTGVLNHLTAMEASKYYKEAMEKMETRKVEEQIQKNSQKFMDSFNAKYGTK